MKLNSHQHTTQTNKLIARFGAARLTRDRKGIVELQGGSASDRQAALEWISLFFHEAAPRVLANN